MQYGIKEYGAYDEAEIMKLYNSVGWSNYTKNPQMLRETFAHSLKIYGAYSEEELLGIIRAVGDGHSIVFIQDILVEPSFQRRGIGKALLQKMMEEYRNVYQMHLLTDNSPKMIAFYQSVGFADVVSQNCISFTRVKYEHL
ncbi:MAG: GNAT family N-acetyltransferase [Peptostreptococcaceae bacterium]|nr:GNAT family N-acetyltransferase [Peptostreptococcaceae bacterium]